MKNSFRISADELHALCFEGAFGDESRLKEISRRTHDSLTNNANSVKDLLNKQDNQWNKDIFKYFKQIVGIILRSSSNDNQEISKILYSFMGNSDENSKYECMTNYSKSIKSHHLYIQEVNKAIDKKEKNLNDYSRVGNALIVGYCDALELAGKFLACLNCFLDLWMKKEYSIDQNSKLKLYDKMIKFKKESNCPEIINSFDNKLRNAHAHGNLNFDSSTLSYICKSMNGSMNVISLLEVMKKYDEIIKFDSAFINAGEFIAVYLNDRKTFLKLLSMMNEYK